MPDFSSREVGDNVLYPESDTMHGVVNEVWIDRYAIAFSILSYLDEFENVPLRFFSIDGVTPATENFASGAYSFLTTAYVAIRADEPPGSPARELYDWVGSEESSALIAGNSSLTVTFLDPVIIRAGE
jgi:ABC-type phosphate transport system substrate-binding protein